MADTLLLDQLTWDLVCDVLGNPAVASDPYSQAQDAASAIKVFKGELWYDTSYGVPYFAHVLGERPSIALLKAYFNTQALTVPGVVTAATFISSIQGRVTNGQVQITNDDGELSASGF